MILAADAVDAKPPSACHRLFAAARGSLDELGLAVLDLLLPMTGPGALLVIDDTLARKRDAGK